MGICSPVMPETPEQRTIASIRSTLQKKLRFQPEAIEVDLLLDQLQESIQSLHSRLNLWEQRIRELIECLPLGLLIASQSGTIHGANPAALKLFDCQSYSALSQWTISAFLELNDSTLSTPASVRLDGVTGKTFEGNNFAADITVCPFISNTVLIVVEDVTRRRELEMMKEEFVSMISHDLRTPLTSLRIFLALVANGRYDDDLTKLHGKAASAETDTERLIGMITSLLDIHKMEAGKLNMNLETTNCLSIIENSINSVASLAENKQVTLEVTPFDEFLAVSADKDFAVQVLVNFLSNAIKFSPANAKVVVFVDEDTYFAKISVKDSGPGISDEAQMKLFNRFEQAGVDGAHMKGGTGLGLAVSKEIVLQHGGEVGVTSKLGSGSTFWFTLPIVSLHAPR